VATEEFKWTEHPLEW